MRPGKRMRIHFRTLLGLSFTLIGLVSIAIISLVVNFMLESQFREYSIRKQEKRNQELVVFITNQYLGNGVWNTGVIREIGVNVLEEGLLLHLADKNGNIIWDAVSYNSGICQSMIQTMTDRMEKHYPAIGGGFITREYPVVSADEQAGTLSIGYYGPFFFTDTEIFFIDTLNSLLFLTAIGTSVIAVISGIFISQLISRPLLKAAESARRLAQGDYSVRCPVSSPTIEVHELVKSVNDLSETLKVQDRLRKQLTADVAHELRTPLAILQSHMEAFCDGVWEPTKERLLDLHGEILRLNKLVEDLAGLAFFESDTLALNRTSISLRNLTEKTLRFFETALREKKLVITLEPGDETIFADEDRIRQVMMNLIANAIKFTPDNGTIVISMIRENKHVAISIADTGIGIPAKDIPFIFERFYRVDKSRTRASGGTGIGLAIVKEIVAAHSGTVTVESEEGKGSRFILRLPVSTDDTDAGNGLKK